MPYNFEYAVSANISAKVVEEMVKQVVEEQTGKRVERIEMRFKTITKGFGPSESTEQVFDGCLVYFKNERQDAPTSAPRFKKETYQ